MHRRVQAGPQLPDILAPPTGYRVESRPAEACEGVSSHSVFRGGSLQGTVSVYDEGMARLGLAGEGGFPMDVSKLVGAEGSALLARLSTDRLRRGQSMNPARLDGGLGGRTLSGVEWFNDAESYRKHSLVWDRGWVDLKMPGDIWGHMNVTEANFFAGVRLYREFLGRGRQPRMACPLLLVNIPPEFRHRLYGAERASEEDGRPFSPNFMVLEHVDGMRLVRHGKFDPQEHGIISPAYVKMVSGQAGKPPERLLADAAEAPFLVMSAAHEAGFCLAGEGHYGNFALRPDGVTDFVSDLGEARELLPEIRERQLVQEAKNLATVFVRFRDMLPKGARELIERPWRLYERDPGLMERWVRRTEETRTFEA